MSKKRNLYIAGSILVITLISCITNPSMSDYESHEMRRFLGSSGKPSYKSRKCQVSNENENISLKTGEEEEGEISAIDFRSICESVVSNLETNPENLLAYIKANSQRDDYFLLSVYSTGYGNLSIRIEKEATMHPNFKRGQVVRYNQDGNIMVSAGSSSSSSSGAVLTQGFLKTFHDERSY